MRDERQVGAYDGEWWMHMIISSWEPWIWWIEKQEPLYGWMHKGEKDETMEIWNTISWYICISEIWALK